MKRRHSGHPKVADEVVVGLVLRRLQGATIAQLVRDSGIHRNTIKKWCTGENRTRCWTKAHAQFQQEERSGQDHC